MYLNGIKSANLMLQILDYACSSVQILLQYMSIPWWAQLDELSDETLLE